METKLALMAFVLALAFAIPSASAFSITFPNGGELVANGSLQNITWTDLGDSSSVRIEYSDNNFATSAMVITDGAPNTGSYEWRVSIDTSSGAKIRISDALNPTISDISDSYFIVIPASSPPRPVTSPTGGACGMFGSFVQGGVCVPDLLINMSTMVLLISFLVIGGAYALAHALESPRLINWAQNEMYQVIGTAVILAVYLSVVGSLNFIGPAFYSSSLAFPGEQGSRVGSPGDWTSVQNHARQYVQCLFDYSSESIQMISFMSTLVGTVSTLTLIADYTVTSVYVPVMPALGGLNQILGVVVGALATSAVQLKLQLSILDLWFGLFNLVLPFGIVLRSFSITRSAGAAMIAIAIGFTVFLPLMYLVIEDVSYHYMRINVCSDSPPQLNSPGYLLSTAFSSVFGGIMGEISDSLSIGGKFSRVIFRVSIEAMILPMFAYLITLNITKRLAEILGGEIDFSALVRLI